MEQELSFPQTPLAAGGERVASGTHDDQGHDEAGLVGSHARPGPVEALLANDSGQAEQASELSAPANDEPVIKVTETEAGEEENVAGQKQQALATASDAEGAAGPASVVEQSARSEALSTASPHNGEHVSADTTADSTGTTAIKEPAPSDYMHSSMPVAAATEDKEADHVESTEVTATASAPIEQLDAYQQEERPSSSSPTRVTFADTVAVAEVGTANSEDRIAEPHEQPLRDDGVHDPLQAGASALNEALNGTRQEVIGAPATGQTPGQGAVASHAETLPITDASPQSDSLAAAQSASGDKDSLETSGGHVAAESLGNDHAMGKVLSSPSFDPVVPTPSHLEASDETGAASGPTDESTAVADQAAAPADIAPSRITDHAEAEKRDDASTAPQSLVTDLAQQDASRQSSALAVLPSESGDFAAPALGGTEANGGTPTSPEGLQKGVLLNDMDSAKAAEGKSEEPGESIAASAFEEISAPVASQMEQGDEKTALPDSQPLAQENVLISNTIDEETAASTAPSTVTNAVDASTSNAAANATSPASLGLPSPISIHTPKTRPSVKVPSDPRADALLARRMAMLLKINKELIRLCVDLQAKNLTSEPLFKEAATRLQANIAFLASNVEPRKEASAKGGPAVLNEDPFPTTKLAPESMLPRLYEVLRTLEQDVGLASNLGKKRQRDDSTKAPSVPIKASKVGSSSPASSIDVAAKASQAAKEVPSSPSKAAVPTGVAVPASSVSAAATPAPAKAVNGRKKSTASTASPQSKATPRSRVPTASSTASDAQNADSSNVVKRPGSAAQASPVPTANSIKDSQVQANSSNSGSGPSPQQLQGLVQTFGQNAVTNLNALQAHYRHGQPQQIVTFMESNIEGFRSMPIQQQMQHMTSAQNAALHRQRQASASSASSSMSQAQTMSRPAPSAHHQQQGSGRNTASPMPAPSTPGSAGGIASMTLMPVGSHTSPTSLPAQAGAAHFAGAQQPHAPSQALGQGSMQQQSYANQQQPLQQHTQGKMPMDLAAQFPMLAGMPPGTQQQLLQQLLLQQQQQQMRQQQQQQQQQAAPQNMQSFAMPFQQPPQYQQQSAMGPPASHPTMPFYGGGGQQQPSMTHNIGGMSFPAGMNAGMGAMGGNASGSASHDASSVNMDALSGFPSAMWDGRQA